MSHADGKFAELLAELEEQQRRLGLPPLSPLAENPAGGFLNLDGPTLRGMSALECEEAAVLLQQFALNLQRWQNRCQASSAWCEQSIRHVIAGSVGLARGYSLEERRPVAVAADPAALRLQQLKVKADALAQDVAYLAARVENQARRFSDLAKQKARKECP